MKRKVLCYRLVPIYAMVFLMVITVALVANKAVQTISETSLLSRRSTFVIDAGHGGEDGGAISSSGVLESSINLEIAMRLNDLMNFLGLQTKMIRIDDISVYTAGESLSQKKISDLKERVRVCNSIDGAILVSIHQNFFTDGRYSGAQVFYNAGHSSQTFAEKLQEAFVTYLNPGSNRKAKKAKGIYLMDHTQRTGVLVECGFLSNPEEEAKLRSAVYQKKLCGVIATTCASFTLDCQTND